jgi:hypothetical protein
VPTVASVRAFCPLHDSSDKAILDSSIGAALETREESSHGGHGGHGGCLKIGNQFCRRALGSLSPGWGSCGTTVPVVLGKTGDVVLNEKKFDLSPIAFSYERLVTTGPNYNYLTCPSFCDLHMDRS